MARARAHTAANDNRKTLAKDIRYELEGTLIEAMGVEDRVRYRKDGFVPPEFRYLSDQLEVEIAAEIASHHKAAA